MTVGVVVEAQEELVDAEDHVEEDHVEDPAAVHEAEELGPVAMMPAGSPGETQEELEDKEEEVPVEEEEHVGSAGPGLEVTPSGRAVAPPKLVNGRGRSSGMGANTWSSPCQSSWRHSAWSANDTFSSQARAMCICTCSGVQLPSSPCWPVGYGVEEEEPVPAAQGCEELQEGLDEDDGHSSSHESPMPVGCQFASPSSHQGPAPT